MTKILASVRMSTEMDVRKKNMNVIRLFGKSMYQWF